MEVIICRDAAEVAHVAADVFEEYVRGPRPTTFGLATGSTPVALYRELIRRHKEEDLSFAGITVFLLDEYVGLPRDHEQSYYRTIRREFTEHVDLNDDEVHSPRRSR